MWKPGAQLPTQEGAEVYPQVMQGPPAMQLTVNASQTWLDQNQGQYDIVADQIMQAYAGNLSHFVQSKRQQYGLGVARQMHVKMDLPGLEAHYENSQGSEIIRITVFPESFPAQNAPLLNDLNLDGYAAYVISYVYFTYTNGAPPEPYTTIPINIIVNGYGCILGYTPDPNKFMVLPPVLGTTPAGTTIPHVQTVILIVAFGPTALRCQSIQDLTANRVPVTGKGATGVSLNTFTAQKGSGGPTGIVAPARLDIPSTIVNGFAVPAHKDLLGYFIFNWEDKFNPDEWAYSGPVASDQGNNINYIDAPDWNFDSLFGKGPPPIVEIIQFASASKSPLNVSGINTIAWQLATVPEPNNIGKSNWYGLACAEFYDRSSIRPATSSWNYPVALGGVLVNDKPIYYAQDGGDPYQSEYGSQTPPPLLNFDLNPLDTSGTGTTGEATFGVFDNAAFPVESPQETIYDANYNAVVNSVIVANNAAAAAHAAAYNAALATLTAAQLAMANANEAIYTVGGSDNSALILAYIYARNPTQTNLTALQTYNNNPSLDALLIAYCQTSLAWQQNTTSATLLSAYTAAEVAMGASATIVVFDYLINIAGTAVFAYSIAYQTAYAKAIAAGDSIATAQALGAAAETAAQNSFTTDEGAVITYATGQGEVANAAAATTAMNNLVTAQNAFDTIAAASTPEYVTPQVYNSISGFKSRKITFANGQWTFGAYS